MATRVVISAPRPAPFFAPLFVAIDKGFLAEQGIEGTIRYGAGLKEMVAGEIDFSSGMAAYKSFLSGMPVRQICGLSSRESSHVLMARPEFESAEQLEHILISGGGATGPQAERFITELTNILAIHGIVLGEAEIETQRVVGSHKEQWQMLQEGIGDAATLGAPWSIIAAKSGYRNLGHESNYAPSPSGAGIYVSPETIARDPQLVAAFVRAYVKAMKYCMENVDGTLDTLMKWSSEWGVDSPEIARAAYDEVSPFWRLQPEPAVLEKAMNRICEQNGVPAVPVTAFLETRFLEDALRS
ncbi:MAG: NitT/TauT family transport system substrate-binding protein [Chloroflexota bacterium]|jgi:ABC-type nitrate/sulfonate/bicarbonate transport system substrate-binding protein|nr:NitT/TauT family transport system substrate-binding protein [Chloroflexota bacterium]